MKKSFKMNLQKFAKFNAGIENLLKTHTNEDGAVDYEALNTDLNEQIAKYNSKNQPDMDKLKAEAYDLAKTDFIKGLKIDGVENENQLKAHISNLSSNEDAQKLIEINKKYEELQTQFNDTNEKLTNTSGELSKFRNENFLRSKNVNPDMLDYVSFKVGQMVNDDTTFEDAFEGWSKENKTFLNPQRSTGVGRVPQPNEDVTLGFEKILQDKGKI